MIISFLNQKGGAGKTTLAVNIARYFTKKNCNVLYIDSDSQGSAQKWHQVNNGELLNMICISTDTIHKDIQKLKNLYDYIFIDGVPRVSTITVSTINCSDLILIPIQPSQWDVWSTEDIVMPIKSRQEATDYRLKAAFIINRKIVNTIVGRDIHNEIDKMGFPALKTETCQRVDYVKCVPKGLTVLDGSYYGSEACNEIEQISKEIEEITNGNH